MQRYALRARAELLGERAEATPLLPDVGVVALDGDEIRHRQPGNGLALALLPVTHLTERLCELTRRVVQERRRDEILADAEVLLGQLGELLRDPAEDVEVGLRLPRRRHGLVERVHERVQVGGREVVLLVPGGRGQDDVGVERRAVHAEVDRREQVELADRRLVAPDDVARAALGRRFLVADGVVLDPEHVPEEVLVALARRAEQVRPPQRQHARPVAGAVRVLGREAQPAGLQLADDVVLDVDALCVGASAVISSGLRSKVG